MRALLLACVVTIGSAGMARAAITSAADPALNGGTVVTFEQLPVQASASITGNGVTFSGNGLLRIQSDFAGNYNTRGTRYLDNDNGAANALIFTFSAPVSAFGFLWGASDDPWLLSAYDAGNALVASVVLPTTNQSNAGDFYGLTGPGITYATLTDAGGSDWVFLDNFTYKAEATAATAVPEPASLALLGLGLAGIAATRRRTA